MILTNELFLSIVFLVRPQLIAAMNSYPCGWLNHSQKTCGCAQAVVTKCQKRISGPLLDRINIHIEVSRVDYEKLCGDRVGEIGATIRTHVQAACDIQNKGFLKNGSADIVCNADMRIDEVRQFCRLQDESQSLMRVAMTQLNLSAHACVQHNVIASWSWRELLLIWRQVR